MRYLRLFALCLLRLCLWMSPLYAQEITDSSTAFFEGADHAYTVTPPNGFKLLVDEARRDGYSFAFVPDEASYDIADLVILGSYMSMDAEAAADFSFKNFIADDTAQMRDYFGDLLTINKVEGITNFEGDTLPTVYLNDTSQFIPTVMISYFYRPRELFIFELVISESYPRFKAEDVFVQALLGFKSLKKGDLSDLTVRK